MKVNIFTEAGSIYGYGHLMRCLALAHGFIDRNIDVCFFIRGDGDVSEILEDFKFINCDWIINIDFGQFLYSNNIAFFDSYHINSEFCEMIIENFIKVVFLDDYNRLSYPGGFVLNSVIGAQDIQYKKNDNVTYLLGEQYQPLRKEFWNVSDFFVKEQITDILLTFGGSDILNLTPKYLRNLSKKFPTSKFHIIIGNSFKNIDEIYRINYELSFFYNQPASSEIVEIMKKCDLAICAAGQTVSELARIGVPTVAIQVAENQEYNFVNWRKCGFLIDEDKLFKNLSYKDRMISSCNGRKRIDGKGVKRIIEAIL